MQDLGYLLVMGRTEHEGHIVESGVGHCRKSFLGHFKDRLPFKFPYGYIILRRR